MGSKISKFFGHLRHQIAPDLTPEQKQFVDDWFQRRTNYMVLVTFWLGVALLVSGVFIVPPFITHETTRFAVYLAFIWGIANSPYWFRVYKTKPQSLKVIQPFATLLALYAIALLMFFFDFANGDPASIYVAVSIVSSLSFFYCAFTPLHSKAININSALIFLAELIAFWKYMPLIYILPVVLINQFCGLIVAWTNVYRERLSALSELERQKAAARVEKSKHDQQLQLAEAIHESFSPESNLQIGETWQAAIYRGRGDRVGGDWVGFRSLPGDKIAALIIDASGKGLQGALVVHAVQSLWAASFSSQTFDPAGWLKSLNTTLIRLGRKTPHTLTAAIAVVSSDRIVVWGAGHCPVYVLEGVSEAQRVKSLVTRGDIVGLTEAFQVTPLAYEFDREVLTRKIILGTDGALEPFMHSKRNNVSHLVERVESEGAAALGISSDGDDRTLVVITAVASSLRRTG